jgi:hypothetical protein
LPNSNLRNKISFIKLGKVNISLVFLEKKAVKYFLQVNVNECRVIFSKLNRSYFFGKNIFPSLELLTTTLATLNKQISEPFYFVSVTLVLSGIHMCGFNVRFSQAMQCKHNPVQKIATEDSKGVLTLAIER